MKNRIVITVQSGLIAEVTTNHDVEVLIFDRDIEEYEETKKYKNEDGREFEAHAYIWKPILNKKEISHYFKQFKGPTISIKEK